MKRCSHGEQKIPVVIIPGNHDAPKRWGALSPLLKRFWVFVVAEVLRPESGGGVEVKSRDGSPPLNCRPALGDRAEDVLGDGDDGSR